MSFTDTAKEKMKSVKVRLALASVSLMGLVSMASAATLNESVGPILDSVVALFVPLLALIIAAVPLIIALAIIGFILGILDGILKMLKI